MKGSLFFLDTLLMRNSAFMPAKGHGNITGFFILDPVFKPTRAATNFVRPLAS